MTTGSYMQVAKEVAPTLMARDYKDPTTIAPAPHLNEGVMGTVATGAHPSGFNGQDAFNDRLVIDNPEAQPTPVTYTVRRLTPTECARLQGFPDWWCRDLGTENPTEEELAFWADVFETHRKIVTHAKKPKTEKQIRKWLADPYTDSAEYRIWGNGICLANAFFVLAGIAYVLLYPCYYPHLTVICTYRKGKQGKNKGEHTMNDKTREQIEAMKNQTIGVEIEMNNITREKAARKVAEYFGTREWNAASEYGYYSWACKDQQGRVWKFQRDVSIYGPGAEKCELVTPILTYDDIETLQEIIRLLRKAGAKSGPSRGCGVHIHIGKGDHTAKTIRNLVNIMAAHEQQIGRAIRIDAGRTGQYCRVVDHRFLDRLNREKPTTMRKLEDIWYEGNGSSWENRNAHYNSSRYHMLNLHATFTKGTIEFRLFQFADPADGKRNGLHAGEMKAYIQLCLAMSQLAKMVRTASPKPQQTDNEKYAMRCWMLRLGFIGDEFATAREILLRNMEGNASWRNK